MSIFIFVRLQVAFNTGTLALIIILIFLPNFSSFNISNKYINSPISILLLEELSFLLSRIAKSRSEKMVEVF